MNVKSFAPGSIIATCLLYYQNSSNDTAMLIQNAIQNGDTNFLPIDKNKILIERFSPGTFDFFYIFKNKFHHFSNNWNRYFK